jgi:hypothetical protein
MDPSVRMTFKDLKPRIADAIKESCYRTDLRIYNIANEVHGIRTTSVQPGVEIAEGLSKIIDKSIKNSVDIGCDLSVIIKGILLGAFRASPFIREEAHKTIHILIVEILHSVFKYKGDTKRAIEGILTAIVIIAREFKLNVQEALTVAKEDITSSTKETSPEFTESIKEALLHLDVTS